MHNHAALLLAIRRHNFSHAEFTSLLHCIAWKADEMAADYTESMYAVRDHLCDAAAGMDDVYAADTASLAREAADDWRAEDRREQAA